MSWTAIVVLASSAYALKAVGPLGVGARALPPRADRVLQLLAVPLLAALVLVQTFDAGRPADRRRRARRAGRGRRAGVAPGPFLVVVLAAAGTAAALRAIG